MRVAPGGPGAGLPVDDRPAAVVAGEHGVDTTAHRDAVDDRLDRHLDLLGDAVGPLAGEEALLHAVEVAVVGSPLVGAAGQVEQVDERGARVVLLDPGVEGGALPGGDRRRARHRAAQVEGNSLGVLGAGRPAPTSTGAPAGRRRRRAPLARRAPARRAARSSLADPRGTRGRPRPARRCDRGHRAVRSVGRPLGSCGPAARPATARCGSAGPPPWPSSSAIRARGRRRTQRTRRRRQRPAGSPRTSVRKRDGTAASSRAPQRCVEQSIEERARVSAT